MNDDHRSGLGPPKNPIKNPTTIPMIGAFSMAFLMAPFYQRIKNPAGVGGAGGLARAYRLRLSRLSTSQLFPEALIVKVRFAFRFASANSVRLALKLL